jgi:hypothetical protein
LEVRIEPGNFSIRILLSFVVAFSEFNPIDSGLRIQSGAERKAEIFHFSEPSVSLW